jgi:CMP-N-acetylneuraminic acid synthetase
MDKLLAVIPARWGSKAIPRKNIFPLCGKPLIQYTIDAVEQSIVEDWVISTDDERIGQFAPWIKRPKRLAKDDTPMVPVIQHAVEVYGGDIDAVVTLQPTSPLRTAEDINAAVEMFAAGNSDSLVSVYEGIHPVKSYDADGKPFLEQIPYDKRKHKCYTRNGAIFITRKDLLDSGRLFSERPLLYIMPKSRSIDIDDYEDMKLTEALLKIMGGNL